MANVTKTNNVRINMERHETSANNPLRSFFTSIFCEGGGAMRSLAERPATKRNTKPTTAKIVMVVNHPCASSLPAPRPNLCTNGKVKPCTTNWATVAATKRMEVMLVRSLMSLVITPPNEL